MYYFDMKRTGKMAPEATDPVKVLLPQTINAFLTL